MKSLTLALSPPGLWPAPAPCFPGLTRVCVVAVNLPPTPSPAPHRKVKPNTPPCPPDLKHFLPCSLGGQTTHSRARGRPRPWERQPSLPALPCPALPSAPLPSLAGLLLHWEILGKGDTEPPDLWTNLTPKCQLPLKMSPWGLLHPFIPRNRGGRVRGPI